MQGQRLHYGFFVTRLFTGRLQARVKTDKEAFEPVLSLGSLGNEALPQSEIDQRRACIEADHEMGITAQAPTRRRAKTVFLHIELIHPPVQTFLMDDYLAGTIPLKGFLVSCNPG